MLSMKPSVPHGSSWVMSSISGKQPREARPLPCMSDRSNRVVRRLPSIAIGVPFRRSPLVGEIGTPARIKVRPRVCALYGSLGGAQLAFSIS